MNNKGFTLVEVLITMGIIAIVGGLMTGIFYTVTEVHQRESASNEVTSQLNFVTQTIQRLVRESSNIEIEAGVTTTTLKLRMADSDKDPTCIILSSNTIKLAEGPDGANPENCTSNTTDLTNNKVVVDSLNFKKFTQYPGHDTVSFDIAMTYNSTDPAAQVQRTLQSAIARVSAATFDANLIPGDTSYTLGQAGSPWQNIFASDGSAANPAYTFSNDTSLGLFRGGSNILGFSTAGTERMRILANGDIGIGTATPSVPLEINPVSTWTTPTLKISGTGSDTAVIQLNRIGTNRWGAIDFSTGGVTDWHLGHYYDGGTANSKFGIGTNYTAANMKFVIDTTGNVGIGTSTPETAKLVVDGTVQGSTPTADNHLATKAYVDAAVGGASGGGLTVYKSDGTTELGAFIGFETASTSAEGTCDDIIYSDADGNITRMDYLHCDTSEDTYWYYRNSSCTGTVYYTSQISSPSYLTNYGERASFQYSSGNDMTYRRDATTGVCSAYSYTNTVYYSNNVTSRTCGVGECKIK